MTSLLRFHYLTASENRRGSATGVLESDVDAILLRLRIRNHQDRESRRRARLTSGLLDILKDVGNLSLRRVRAMAVSAADSLFVLLTASFLWASIVMTGALGENCDMDYIEKCYQEYDALIKPDKSVFNPKQPDLLDAAVERYSRNFLSETPCYAYVRQNCTNPVYHKYYRIEEATYSTYYKVASNTNQLKRTYNLHSSRGDFAVFR